MGEVSDPCDVMSAQRNKSLVSAGPLDPRGERRAERMLDAAVAEFTAKGWRNTRLDDIVARSGGSMATLYRAFGNKKGLVHALIAREAEQLCHGLRALENDDLPPEEALASAATGIIDILLKPETLVINLIAVGEGRDVLEIRYLFFQQNVTPAHQLLRAYLQRQHDAGRLHVPDPVAASNVFFMSLFGDMLFRWISGIDPAPDEAGVRERIPAILSIFIEGLRPRG